VGFATRIENVTIELIQINQNIGHLKGRLAHDDKLLVTARDLRQQSNEKAGELAIWQQVEEAIGSANGDPFRTVAQSLTLEHLVSPSFQYRIFRSRSTKWTSSLIWSSSDL